MVRESPSPGAHARMTERRAQPSWSLPSQTSTSHPPESLLFSQFRRRPSSPLTSHVHFNCVSLLPETIRTIASLLLFLLQPVLRVLFALIIFPYYSQFDRFRKSSWRRWGGWFGPGSVTLESAQQNMECSTCIPASVRGRLVGSTTGRFLSTLSPTASAHASSTHWHWYSTVSCMQICLVVLVFCRICCCRFVRDCCSADQISLRRFWNL